MMQIKVLAPDFSCFKNHSVFFTYAKRLHVKKEKGKMQFIRVDWYLQKRGVPLISFLKLDIEGLRDYLNPKSTMPTM
jgi:hypothetical protein